MIVKMKDGRFFGLFDHCETIVFFPRLPVTTANSNRSKKSGSKKQRQEYSM